MLFVYYETGMTLLVYISGYIERTMDCNDITLSPIFDDGILLTIDMTFVMIARLSSKLTWL